MKHPSSACCAAIFLTRPSEYESFFIFLMLTFLTSDFLFSFFFLNPENRAEKGFVFAVFSSSFFSPSMK